VVKPETLVGWHRKAFQLFWRWKSRGGRPRVPGNLRALIAQMVRENPTWGQRRVASELALKLGIHISPRTIRAYWPEELGPSHRRDAQCWMTFVRNHAKAMVACDFAVAVTLWFQILYLFVVLDLGMDAQELARLQEEAKRFSETLLAIWREQGFPEAFLSAARAELENPWENLGLLDQLMENGGIWSLQ